MTFDKRTSAPAVIGPVIGQLIGYVAGRLADAMAIGDDPSAIWRHPPVRRAGFEETPA